MSTFKSIPGGISIITIALFMIMGCGAPAVLANDTLANEQQDNQDSGTTANQQNYDGGMEIDGKVIPNQVDTLPDESCVVPNPNEHIQYLPPDSVQAPTNNDGSSGDGGCSQPDSNNDSGDGGSMDNSNQDSPQDSGEPYPSSDEDNGNDQSSSCQTNDSSYAPDDSNQSGYDSQGCSNNSDVSQADENNGNDQYQSCQTDESSCASDDSNQSNYGSQSYSNSGNSNVIQAPGISSVLANEQSRTPGVSSVFARER